MAEEQTQIDEEHQGAIQNSDGYNKETGPKKMVPKEIAGLVLFILGCVGMVIAGACCIFTLCNFACGFIGVMMVYPIIVPNINWPVFWIMSIIVVALLVVSFILNTTSDRKLLKKLVMIAKIMSGIQGMLCVSSVLCCLCSCVCFVVILVLKTFVFSTM